MAIVGLIIVAAVLGESRTGVRGAIIIIRDAADTEDRDARHRQLLSILLKLMHASSSRG